MRTFKAASQVRVTEALRRIAAAVEAGKISPQDASVRLSRVKMALSQTAEEAAQAWPFVASSREEVVAGFRSANPDLSGADLEGIVNEWASKGAGHKSAGALALNKAHSYFQARLIAEVDISEMTMDGMVHMLGIIHSEFAKDPNFAHVPEIGGMMWERSKGRTSGGHDVTTTLNIKGSPALPNGSRGELEVYLDFKDRSVQATVRADGGKVILDKEFDDDDFQPRFMGVRLAMSWKKYLLDTVAQRG